MEKGVVRGMREAKVMGKGVTSHEDLDDRDATDQHPASAITYTPDASEPIGMGDVQSEVAALAVSWSIVDSYSGDYGTGWTNPPSPSPTNLDEGYMFVAHNTADDTYRAYFYVNSGWRYIDLS